MATRIMAEMVNRDWGFTVLVARDGLPGAWEWTTGVVLADGTFKDDSEKTHESHRAALEHAATVAYGIEARRLPVAKPLPVAEPALEGQEDRPLRVGDEVEVSWKHLFYAGKRGVVKIAEEDDHLVGVDFGTGKPTAIDVVNLIRITP